MGTIDTSFVYVPADTVSYSLSGTDAALFDIAGDGTVTFNTAPDYEVDPRSYSFTVTASDGNGGSADQAVTVNVNDVAENTTPVVPPTPTGGVVLDFGGIPRMAMAHTSSRRVPSTATVGTKQTRLVLLRR